MKEEMNKQEKLRVRFEEYFSRRDLTRKNTDSTQYSNVETQNKWVGFKACAMDFDLI